MRADPRLLEMVVTNLVINARDAMPGGGALTLATGLTGNELALLLRADQPGLKVVLMTGYAPEEVSTNGGAEEADGADDLLRKPFTPEELLTAVRRELQRA